MSETRRQIFRNSILSAFGLTSATALAACGNFAPWGESGERTPDVLSPVIVGNSQSDWYIFYGTKNTYKVFKLKDPTKLPTLVPSQIAFDTVGWFSTLTATDYDQITSAFNFYIGGNPIQLSFTGNYLDSGSVSDLRANAHQNMGAWNEIGKA
jgi:hypothetical protein